MRLEAELERGISGRDARLGFRDMTLGDLLDGLEPIEIAPSGPAWRELRISSLDYDSRRIGPGSMFFALAGAKADGNEFVVQAVDRGAIAVVSEQARPAGLAEVAIWVRVRRARRALALAAANFYRRPAQALSLVGVTGTNGKTTTTFLIDSILRTAGRRTGLFGTVLWRTPARAVLASTTTPESLELSRLFAELRDASGTDAVLEVSSHALALDRVWGCHFAVAVFTNLTRDHLDFHGTMESYFAAKRRLFEGTGAGAPDTGVINLDDPHGPALAGLARLTLSYGVASPADVTAGSYRLDSDGLAFTARTPAGPIELRSRMVGAVNVSNILAATATALALRVDREAIARGVARMVTVPGRFERVEQGQPFVVAVDYAHTDDALRRLLDTARDLKMPGRILLLFGAGGDRDRAKRRLMGEAAARGADLAVVTSDNPRSEDPLAIIDEILPGLAGAKHIVEPDRARAIARILAEARPGDIVLLAGKGHETYQALRDRTVPFDDRLVARQALGELGYERNQAAPGGEAAG